MVKMFSVFADPSVVRAILHHDPGAPVRPFGPDRALRIIEIFVIWSRNKYPAVVLSAKMKKKGEPRRTFEVELERKEPLARTGSTGVECNDEISRLKIYRSGGFQQKIEIPLIMLRR